MSDTQLRIEYLPLADLQPYANNARLHSAEQIAQIATSMRAFGWTNPILADDAGLIIAGHGRLAAAQQLGIAEAPVIRIAGLSDEQRRALTIADNKLGLNAGWDEQLLAAELQSLGDLQGVVGFSADELMRLLTGDGDGGAGSLAEKFGVPPFSILNAREGWWQDRKRAWIALGIESELGRGNVPIGGSPLPLDRANAITPGGSLMPAADYSNRQRGNGKGQPIA